VSSRNCQPIAANRQLQEPLMSEVKIVEVDEQLHAFTNMRPGTRMVAVQVPTDRAVTLHATVNARMLQRVQIWDAEGRMHFEWEGRGEQRTLGAGSRTFSNPPLLIGCQSLRVEHWIVNDINVCADSNDGQRRVLIRYEDGGDVPVDWDDTIVELTWAEPAA